MSMVDVWIRVQEIQEKIRSYKPNVLKEMERFSSSASSRFSSKLDGELAKSRVGTENQNLSLGGSKELFSKESIVKEFPVKIGGSEVVNSERMVSFESSFEKKKGDRWLGIIREASEKYGVPLSLIRSVIQQESNFDPHAVSHKGARGLMQLMPQTARELGVENVFDPRENVLAGTRHLRSLMDRFSGNLPLSLASYNAGLRRVLESGGVPGIEETRNYVDKVLRQYEKAKNLDLRK